LRKQVAGGEAFDDEALVDEAQTALCDALNSNLIAALGSYETLEHVRLQRVPDRRCAQHQDIWLAQPLEVCEGDSSLVVRGRSVWQPVGEDERPHPQLSHQQGSEKEHDGEDDGSGLEHDAQNC